MKDERLLRIAFVIALAGVLPGAAPPAQARGHHGLHADAGLTGHGDLLPPVDGPQPDATGEVSLRSSSRGDRLAVEVEHVDAAVALSLFIDDGTGTMVEAGAFAGSGDERSLVFDTRHGDALPGGATALADLSGRSLAVRDGAGADVLVGAVPALDTPGAHGDGEHPAHPERARAALQRAADSPFPAASGSVLVTVHPFEQELDVRAENLVAGAAVELFLEDAAAVLTSVGTAAADEHGGVRFEFGNEAANHPGDADDDDGDDEDDDDGAAGDDDAPLPFGAAGVADLAGRRIEIRSSPEGALVLFGTVPAATESADHARARSAVSDAVTGASARLEISLNSRAGRERLRVDVRGLPRSGGTAVLLLDDGSGTLVEAATASASRGGHARFRFDASKGPALPLGAESVRDLAGRAFQVQFNGGIVLSGNLPVF